MNKILIVDDQPAVRELLKTTLEINDYQLLSAEDGLQAITIAQTEQPDLIILDVMMPNGELDGLEVCRRLKADPTTARTVIIMVSAKGQQSDIEAGLRAGADDYIDKPFSPVALIRKVEHIINVNNL
ncbi:MAG: response regulator [Anaerolineae bacterium]|nr:response regulator [Anaerolineae bacterium]